MTHAKPRHPRWPALPGALLALAAAALFGLSTPLVQQLGAGLGSFSTAGLLYLGAALAGWLQRQPREREARLQRGDLPRLLGMAGFGAALGPVALAWGLQQAPGSSASLMLTLEAVFTALLARWWYGEQLDRRVLAALALLTLGGMGLVLDQAGPAARHGAPALAGLLAVALATAAWGVDNSLSRPLSARDPGQVVAAKGGLGALLTLGLALALDEPRPTPWTALGLLAVGASGYGLSLRCYLLAQRGFGAARTASVFAFAPFIGAAAAWALGERLPSPLFFGGAGLMAAGLLLHMAESHDHGHAHEALQHEHAHRHDDGHHDDHVHEPMPTGLHSHPHQHAARWHAHPHVPDEHHGHAH